MPSANQYNEEYFERGPITGISGYMNYSWMPELTLRMAHYMITQLPLEANAKVLDFGCAKGFLVKALRILGVDAYGCDISAYAISNSDSAVSRFCSLATEANDISIFNRDYDWMIAKDVFEHIPEPELQMLLVNAKNSVNRMFVVVPLGVDDTSNKFVVPEYDKDITHVLARSKQWWIDFFEAQGWKVNKFSYSFLGCKENWTYSWPEGNSFFQLQRK
jgi:predicted TPR repeat methyltransferase